MSKVNLKAIMDYNRLNILLSHSPTGFIFNNDFIVKDRMDNIGLFDLVLTGHYHGGLMPNFLQKVMNNHYGLISPGPKYRLFPGGSYGIYNNNGTSLLISNGIDSLPESTGKFLSSLGKCCKSNIEVIDFERDNKKILIKR